MEHLSNEEIKLQGDQLFGEKEYKKAIEKYKYIIVSWHTAYSILIYILINLLD